MKMQESQISKGSDLQSVANSKQSSFTVLSAKSVWPTTAAGSCSQDQHPIGHMRLMHLVMRFASDKFDHFPALILSIAGNIHAVHYLKLKNQLV